MKQKRGGLDTWKAHSEKNVPVGKQDTWKRPVIKFVTRFPTVTPFPSVIFPSGFFPSETSLEIFPLQVESGDSSVWTVDWYIMRCTITENHSLRFFKTPLWGDSLSLIRANTDQLSFNTSPSLWLISFVFYTGNERVVWIIGFYDMFTLSGYIIFWISCSVS